MTGLAAVYTVKLKPMLANFCLATCKAVVLLEIHAAQEVAVECGLA